MDRVGSVDAATIGSMRSGGSDKDKEKGERRKSGFFGLGGKKEKEKGSEKEVSAVWATPALSGTG
jgi:hypothetical protein